MCAVTVESPTVVILDPVVRVLYMHNCTRASLSNTETATNLGYNQDTQIYAWDTIKTHRFTLEIRSGYSDSRFVKLCRLGLQWDVYKHLFHSAHKVLMAHDCSEWRRGRAHCWFYWTLTLLFMLLHVLWCMCVSMSMLCPCTCAWYVCWLGVLVPTRQWLVAHARACMAMCVSASDFCDLGYVQLVHTCMCNSYISLATTIFRLHFHSTYKWCMCLQHIWYGAGGHSVPFALLNLNICVAWQHLKICVTLYSVSSGIAHYNLWKCVYIYTCACMYASACIIRVKRALARTLYAHIHACMHACIHTTYTQTHIHTQTWRTFSLFPK